MTERKSELWLAAASVLSLILVYVALCNTAGFDFVAIAADGARSITIQAGAVQAWGTLCTTVASIGIGYTAARAVKKIKEAGAK